MAELEPTEEALARARLHLGLANYHARYAPTSPHPMFARSAEVEQLLMLMRTTVAELAKQVERMASDAERANLVLSAGELHDVDDVVHDARQAFQTAAARVDEARSATRQAVFALERLRLKKP